MTSHDQQAGTDVEQIRRLCRRPGAKTDQHVGELSKAVARIGDVVKLITATAKQTNLLALDATIEAACAGDAGKGLAVVAQEVQALAAQTAKATGEIGARVNGIQTATGESVVAIKRIGVIIARISEIAGAISWAVEQQGIATGEITQRPRSCPRNHWRVGQADVDPHAEETGMAATQILSAAQSLSQDSQVRDGSVPDADP